ncbi:dicarboxylate/amino acid:cation symporter [Massilia glaciei]|uniref:Dicarboxylate/amino acid:cation symporter n=1 Tax=Massilia glaciei TaxID=1524097 RepID=A0A2U2HHP4_9BURK|nr:dicarboxylate/amino acid:cation symporter [Massilia glaciei]PWF45428.1 dicarboxylate/amino acid:cation symporter [Massilia glaciei]
MSSQKISPLARWFGIPLWKRVMSALVLGVLAGLFLPGLAPHVAFLGEIFVRLIRMLVAPIVLVTIAAGVTALGEPKRLGMVGGRTLLLFGSTTILAVALGMAIALLLQPGTGANLGGAIPKALGATKSVPEQLLGIIPLNIFEALAKGDMLAIIFVALMLGVGTIAAGEAGLPMAALFQSASAVILRIVTIVMEVTPFGVFALIANSVAVNGAAVFINVGWLALCVVLGSALQIVLVHGLLLRLVARLPPLPFYRGIADALLVAFSTASSSATLPVAIRVAGERLGVGKAISMTVLPLGAAIGKDGTAMYVGMLSVFSLQALGVELPLAAYAVILLTATLAAFGTAPVPSASLFMLAAVLAAVGVGVDQTALIVGFILPFDRLLDMTRTVASASANLAVTTTVARLEGELDESHYRRQAGPDATPAAARPAPLDV